MPSVWHEPFGRVAAEAMVNGIPVLISDRGALPQVIGGDVDQGGAGRALALPDYLTPESLEVPHPHEVQPWFDAVCAFWDDSALYERASRQGRELAQRWYSEAVLRQKHVDHFESLVAGRS